MKSSARGYRFPICWPIHLFVSHLRSMCFSNVILLEFLNCLLNLYAPHCCTVMIGHYSHSPTTFSIQIISMRIFINFCFRFFLPFASFFFTSLYLPLLFFETIFEKGWKWILRWERMKHFLAGGLTSNLSQERLGCEMQISCILQVWTDGHWENVHYGRRARSGGVVQLERWSSYGYHPTRPDADLCRARSASISFLLWWPLCGIHFAKPEWMDIGWV